MSSSCFLFYYGHLSLKRHGLTSHLSVPSYSQGQVTAIGFVWYSFLNGSLFYLGKYGLAFVLCTV